MSIYFTRLKVGYPKPRAHPADWADCWRVYTICATNTKGSCTTLADVNALGSQLDQSDARRTYSSLLRKAHTGEDFRNLYDEKKCHEAHAFKHTTLSGQTITVPVWRIWGSGKIRTYFLYLPGKRIVVLKTWAKRADRLDTAQEKELEALAESVLHCLEQSATFELSEI